MVNLENDILSSLLLQKKAKDHNYAVKLYCALCNIRWFKNDEEWACTWRYAGGLVAELRDQGEDYLDFYCSNLHEYGHTICEGDVDKEIEEDLKNLGWIWKNYDDFEC